MKSIERRPSWQLALSAIVIATAFSIIILFGYELIVAQSIVLFSFFILSRKIKLQMYVAAVCSAAILTVMMNASMLIWIAPSLVIPLVWLPWNRTGINFILVLSVSLVLYTGVYMTAYAIGDEIIKSNAINIVILLILGESISSSIICYLGEEVAERIS